MQIRHPSKKNAPRAKAPRVEPLESRRLLAVGPDGFGYVADTTAPLDYDLDPFDFDVITLMSNHDDTALAINLGADTFNFYGENVSQIWVSDNGLITVNEGGSIFANAYNNTDLTREPNARVIAPLWDDWTTAEGPGSAVLYMLEDRNNNGTPERLIIEWHNVRQRDLGDDSNLMTFQAILQLNTGSTPGEVYFNYPDIQGDVFSSEGAMATVGIKDGGTQGPRRLLIAHNQAVISDMVGTGKAIKIAVVNDPDPPQVTSTRFNPDAPQPELEIGFTEDVSPSLTAEDLQMTNLTTGQPAGQSTLNSEAPNTYRFAFPAGSLPEGNYRAVIKADSVTDKAGNQLSADIVYEFFVLPGDANHDRTVDFKDLVVLAQNYGTTGKTFGQGNFDYDPSGNVNFSDLVILAQKYGTTLAPPAAASSQTIVKAPAPAPVFSTTPVAQRKPAKSLRKR
jgi:hypothetical protein